MHNIKVWHLAAFFLVSVLGSMGLSAIGVSFDGIAIFITAAALVVLCGPPAHATQRENYE